MTDAPTRAKAAFAPVRAAMADFAPGPVREALAALILPDAPVRLCHPFGTLTGPDAWHDAALAPLFHAFPDLERRDVIVMAGHDGDGALWLGTTGHYMGTFARPFLDIPPTGHPAALRHAEFFRFDGTRVAEVQAVWDIPDLMLQAGAWPMAPALGREWLVPGPATQDGLVPGPHDPARAAASGAIVAAMLTAMTRHPREPVAAMDLVRYWHPRFNWYGPAGIGSTRGIAGFRNWHQIPFLAAMPDRGLHRERTDRHFFADGDYAAVTGWPNMCQTLTGAGWLGLPATGQVVTMRSLDFWRLEAGLIRENWVLIDLLDVYAQIGLDPLARMRQCNLARPGSVPGSAAGMA